jgi:4-amino-4-deoxy-L-arabinose transferase-like glycosyltransferase
VNIALNKTINMFFWVFTVSVAFILTLPVLVQDGMFMDGTLYSAVSHNLANGIGTFWFPSFSYNNLAGIHDSFHEQPPLVFAIQSLFFKLFGDSMYVERFYTLLCLIVNMFLIRTLWREIFKTDKHTQELSWLPVLFWITVPVCFWSFSNNMHENTVSMFILLAVLFIYELITQKQKIAIRLILAGVFIFLASFSKGLPGLFPIAIPFVFLYKDQISFKKALLYAGVLFLVVASLYGIMLLSSSARESLYNYAVLRLFKRVNDVPTTTNYLDTLFRLIFESGIMAALVLIVRLCTRKFTAERTEHPTRSITFFLIGLLGILPLMLTLVQKGFYMVPALPFIAIGFSILIAPQVNILFTRLEESKLLPALKIIFILVAITTITLPVINLGKSSRDKELLEDIHRMGAVIPEKSVINCSKEFISDWSLQTYLSRYYFISLDINIPHDYYLCNKNEYREKKSLYDENYEVVDDKMHNYTLLRYR